MSKNIWRITVWHQGRPSDDKIQRVKFSYLPLTQMIDSFSCKQCSCIIEFIEQVQEKIKRHLQFAADDTFRFCCFFKNNKKGMIFHENCLGKMF